MKYKTIAKTIICSNSKCIYFRLLGKENIILHSFYKTRQGKGEDIVAKSVERHSHPLMGQHITDDKAQEHLLTKSQQ